MGSWSQGIYDRGVREGKAEGIMQGKAEGAENKQLEMLKQFIANNHTFNEFVNLFNITDKNEIKFLRENL